MPFDMSRPQQPGTFAKPKPHVGPRTEKRLDEPATFRLLPGGPARVKDDHGITVVEAGDTIETVLPLDTMFLNRWEKLPPTKKQAKLKKARSAGGPENPQEYYPNPAKVDDSTYHQTAEEEEDELEEEDVVGVDARSKGPKQFTEKKKTRQQQQEEAEGEESEEELEAADDDEESDTEEASDEDEEGDPAPKFKKKKKKVAAAEAPAKKKKKKKSKE